MTLPPPTLFISTPASGLPIPAGGQVGRVADEPCVLRILRGAGLARSRLRGQLDPGAGALLDVLLEDVGGRQAVWTDCNVQGSARSRRGRCRLGRTRLTKTGSTCSPSLARVA